MKRTFELIAPCHFGLEAVLKKEILDLGYEISLVEDGRVTFIGDEEAVCRANVFLRTAERVLLKVGSFEARTFEELFQGTREIPWEEYIPQDGKFWVAKASSIKSKLFSPSDIQSIMKKAMVERMKGHYNVNWFPEDGASFPLRVFLYKDVVTVGIDTSGDSLHKRGYRTLTAKAPITETLAAALILLTPWNRDRILVDPFCGSGTFPIEAAMMAANMGVNEIIRLRFCRLGSGGPGADFLMSRAFGCRAVKTVLFWNENAAMESFSGCMQTKSSISLWWTWCGLKLLKIYKPHIPYFDCESYRN